MYVCACYYFFLDGCSKDVRLPANLQRAMAAEAEATREAKAKVCNDKHSHVARQLLQ